MHNSRLLLFIIRLTQCWWSFLAIETSLTTTSGTKEDPMLSAHAIGFIQICMKKKEIVRSNMQEVHKSNKLAIIQSSNGKDLEEYDRTSSYMRCYAKRQGYLYFQDIFHQENRERRIQKNVRGKHLPYHFFNYRWQSLEARYFHTAEWVLALDGDTIPYNFNADIMKYLDVELPNESVDIVLHMRDSWEIPGGVVAFRTNSTFSSCFLDYWYHSGKTKNNINFDNGDLMEMIFDLILYQRNEKLNCSFSFINNVMSMNKCFAARLYPLLLQDAGYHNGIPPFPNMLGVKLKGFPIRIYFPFSGFWKSFSMKQNKGLFSKCLPSDILFHDDAKLTKKDKSQKVKNIGETFFSKELYACSEFKEISAIDQETGRLKNCSTLPNSVIIDSLKSKCYWHAKECLKKTGDDIRNICYEQEHCKNSPFWYHRLGIGDAYNPG